MKTFFVALIAFVSGLFAGYCCFCSKVPESRVLTRLRVDTVRVAAPTEVVVLGRRRERRYLPLAADSSGHAATAADSAVVEVPFERKMYSDTAYRAYVSGYDVSLDSLVFVSRQVCEVLPPARRRRLSVALQAGYGFTPAGPQPYVGIGIAFRLY